MFFSLLTSSTIVRQLSILKFNPFNHFVIGKKAKLIRLMLLLNLVAVLFSGFAAAMSLTYVVSKVFSLRSHSVKILCLGIHDLECWMSPGKRAPTCASVIELSRVFLANGMSDGSI